MALKAPSSIDTSRLSIWAARLVVLTAFFDLFVQFPTIAPHARSLGATTILVGVVVAAYSVTNLFGNLGAGFVLDRWGRRRPMILGLAITAIAVVSYAFVNSPEQLLVARAVHGIGAAALTPGAFAILGDRVASDQRGRAMGLAGALIAIPAMIGPPVAGILRDAWGADAVFFVDAAFVAFTLVVFVTVTRENPTNRLIAHCQRRSQRVADQPRPLVGIRRPVRYYRWRWRARGALATRSREPGAKQPPAPATALRSTPSCQCS